MSGLEEVIMAVLHATNPNHCFTSLIRFMYEEATLSGDRPASAEFLDGVLRCLLEKAKNMVAYMPKLDVDMLLYDCHMFLVSHPPSKYRGKEFRPLRLLKTILNELVKIKAEGIRVHLSLVPVETKPTLCSYIELVLQQHLSARSQPAAEKQPATKYDIAFIFDKIGSKEKDVAKEGFKLLHQYQKDHADFNLEHFLAGRSPLFQEHVHKNLAKVASNAQVGPSSTSLSGTMPLQPSSLANLNREGSVSDGPKGALGLMAKFQGIRSTYTGTAGAETAPPAPTASSEEPSMVLSKSVTSLSSSMLASSSSVPASSASVEAEEADGLRASKSVLSLQERLAKLRA